MLAYDAAHTVAGLVVKRGRTVVLECTYARQEQRLSLVQALAAVPEVPLRIVEFYVSPDEAVLRFRQRTQGTDLDEGAVRERAEGFPYSPQTLRLNSSTASPDRLATELTQWLRKRPAQVQPDVWAAAGRGWA